MLIVCDKALWAVLKVGDETTRIVTYIIGSLKDEEQLQGWIGWTTTKSTLGMTTTTFKPVLNSFLF